jgi:type II secretory pathway pseudopilin PulG
MVALVGGAIAPALVVSVATRVHSQKAEQALALAQSEIDKTRVLVERGSYTIADLPASAPTLSDKDVKTAVGAKLSVTDPTKPDYAKPVDVNGDGKDDFLVQRYRAKGEKSVDGIPIAFAMGVRVYDINVTGTGNLPTDQASLIMTSGDGGRGTHPLATLYTTIAASNEGDSLCSLTTYFNSTVETGQKKTLPTVCTAP